MGLARIAKPAGMTPVAMIKPATMAKLVNPAQSIQGQMGKAQGYLGGLSGTPVDVTGKKNKDG
jgi:uncharacterized protein YdbL (DUF1318 family)